MGDEAISTLASASGAPSRSTRPDTARRRSSGSRSTRSPLPGACGADATRAPVLGSMATTRVGPLGEAGQREAAVGSGLHAALPATAESFERRERDVEQRRVEQADHGAGQRGAIAAEHDAALRCRGPIEHEQQVVGGGVGGADHRAELVALQQREALGEDRQRVLRLRLVGGQREAPVGAGLLALAAEPDPGLGDRATAAVDDGAGDLLAIAFRAPQQHDVDLLLWRDADRLPGAGIAVGTRAQQAAGQRTTDQEAAVVVGAHLDRARQRGAAVVGAVGQHERIGERLAVLVAHGALDALAGPTRQGSVPVRPGRSNT